MKLKLRSVLMACMLLVSLLFITACGAEATPYEKNDADNYSVSVRYDANGGIFTTNTSVIVDSYNISDLPVNSGGQVEIALLSPDDARRSHDAFSAVNNGHFLAGWYAQRTENADGTYSYSDAWNFEEDVLEVDPNGSYTASEPVVTLYAVWVPMFAVEFYDLASGEYLDSYTYNPTLDGEILVPTWDEESGAIEMYKFPERDGYTFNGAYYDAEGTQAVDTAALVHSGTVDVASGTAQNAVLKVYIDWMEGEWYHIYTAEQLKDNASVNGSYILHADLDFSDEIWPTSFMYGNFAGTIQGNGHTISNVVVEQTNNSKVYAGVFGNLTESACLSDVKFENVTFTIKAGTRVAGAAYGVLAGNISSGAKLEGVEILSGTLQIDSGCYFGTDDYVIGLLCGAGDSTVVDYSNIVTAPVGDNADSVVITVDGNEVAVEFVTE